MVAKELNKQANLGHHMGVKGQGGSSNRMSLATTWGYGDTFASQQMTLSPILWPWNMAVT